MLSRIRAPRSRETFLSAFVCVLLAGFGVLSGSSLAAPDNFSSSSLQSTCVRAGLKMPKILEAKMYYPGRRIPPRMQSVNLRVEFDGLPAECSGKFRRLSQVKAQIQDAKRPRVWINLDPAIKWRDIWPYDATTNTGGNMGGVGGAIIASNGHEGNRVYYRCSPGPRKTRARAFFRNQIRDLKTGRIIRQKIIKRPIKIRGGGC